MSGMPARNAHFELSSPSNVYLLIRYVSFFHVICTVGRCINSEQWASVTDSVCSYSSV